MPMRPKLQAADTPDAITRPPVMPSEPAANPVSQSHSALGSLLVRLANPRPIMSRPRPRIRSRNLCAPSGRLTASPVASWKATARRRRSVTATEMTLDWSSAISAAERMYRKGN